MAASAIVAVRSALIAGLAPLGSLRGIDVSYQYRAGSESRERLWTQRARFELNPAALRAGRNYRDEVGLFDLVILVEGVGQTAEWAATRALEIGLVVEEYVADRKNNELDVVGLQTFQMKGEGALIEAFNDSGNLAELTYPIRYTARLT